MDLPYFNMQFLHLQKQTLKKPFDYEALVEETLMTCPSYVNELKKMGAIKSVLGKRKTKFMPTLDEIQRRSLKTQKRLKMQQK